MFRFAMYHSKTKDYSFHELDTGFALAYPFSKSNMVWIIIDDERDYDFKKIAAKFIFIKKALVQVPWSIYSNQQSLKSRYYINVCERFPIISIIHGPRYNSDVLSNKIIPH